MPLQPVPSVNDTRHAISVLQQIFTTPTRPRGNDDEFITVFDHAIVVLRPYNAPRPQHRSASRSVSCSSRQNQDPTLCVPSPPACQHSSI